jgi:hypothetical protein
MLHTLLLKSRGLHSGHLRPKALAKACRIEIFSVLIIVGGHHARDTVCKARTPLLFPTCQFWFVANYSQIFLDVFTVARAAGYHCAHYGGARLHES